MKLLLNMKKESLLLIKKRKRTGWDPNLEIALLLWLHEFRLARSGVVITDPVLQQAGGRLIALLNEEDNHKSMRDYGNTVSEGYIQSWKKRYNQQQEKLYGESTSAEINSSNSRAEIQLPLIIEKYGIENKEQKQLLLIEANQNMGEKIKEKSDCFSWIFFFRKLTTTSDN
ncbi:MAG: hypothetical protein EZS28_042053 [Streblomastix strix]|uniref:HTH CENPB-type domain-containing protein n=1 Tax=Streblomastix strix TaxID=222440 RepID=A0A5J4TWH0_9EUKA|nr:MAG: hypothetical protein EZS28_042053 [Streblomastix strix]